MKYYHGSPFDNLTTLKPQNKGGKVFVSTDKTIAVWYCVKKVLYQYDWDNKNNVMVIKEFCPNMIKKIFLGRKGFVYSCNLDENFPLTKETNTVFSSKKAIPINQKQEIADVYGAIKYLESCGKIKIIEYNQLSNKEKERIKSFVQNNLAFIVDWIKEEKNLSLKEKQFLINFYKTEFKNNNFAKEGNL